jgi:23S rRNA (guanine2445-N2)-methyltransferase / 23S rRNA (guanine2069-N7)-methyltransferase
MEQQFFATAPRGFSDLLARELARLGASAIQERSTGVRFRGSLEVGYRACLWSRIASRVLLELLEFEADDAEAFYRGVMGCDWAAHIDPARTIACEFTGASPYITNTHYGALRLKDGICDRLRAHCGARPDVALVRPAVRIMAHAQGTHITLSIDLAGEGLHRRGYRTEAGEAPLRENLAAGLLLRARWDEFAARGAEFLDPLCGSGTLVIEAASIAAERAPALLREYFGFLGWRGHDAALWQRLLDQARSLARSTVASLIRGSDIDARALAIGAANADRAGVGALVRFDQLSLATVQPLSGGRGLICTNPPYGERLGDSVQAREVHAELGRVLRERFAGWEAAILTRAGDLARELHLRSYRVHEVYNGAIACRFLRIDLAAPGSADSAAVRHERAAAAPLSAGAQMFANRIEKNLKLLGKAAQRAAVSCYRLYDADMPEYSFAIDHYLASESEALHLHIQEYAAPKEIAIEAARRRRGEVLVALARVFKLPPERIHLRLRERQSGAAQYQRLHTTRRASGAATTADSPGAADASGASGAGQSAITVNEAGLKFLVNLEEYLDTGLFLDQRLTRARLREQAPGTRFLNLFCYTASASVYAAAGRARESLSIDLSNRYLDWAAQNFELNGLEPARHRLERADCREWLRAAAAEADGTKRREFELIFLDPPTFSNSKRMRGVLDIQRDHPDLIDCCMRLLAPAGLLVFSTNAQHFRMQDDLQRRWDVRDISPQTLPFDFARHPRIHRCYEIRARLARDGLAL